MRLWISFAVIGVLVLSGCPKPSAEKTDVEVSTTSTNPETVASSESSGTTPAETPEDKPAVPGGNETGETAHKPSPAELKGKWFALYGGTGIGAKAYTYENGHRLEFADNGIAIWEIAGNGGDQIQVVSKWDASSGDVTVTVEKPGDMAKANTGSTPLAFGRDDEVGLTGSESAAQPAVFRFTPEVDGGFLALKGMKGELMVYGRAENSNAEAAPDVSGDWVLVSAPGQQDEVTVKMVDGQMETSWGPYHNSFKGKFSHGYFIGMVGGSAGTAFAAVAPKPDGTLDGVISVEPYDKWQSTFDFTRAAK